jgi:predicted peptidase
MKIVSHFNSSCMPDIKLGFVLTAPDDLDVTKENLPLIVFLHGAGERGTDPEKVCLHGIPKLFSADPVHQSQRVITLSPQCPEGLVWNNVVLAVKELIDSVMSDYKIDHNKVSITGLSMGGFGTWEMILTYPHFFSCAAPVCGGGLSWRCASIAHMPITAFHGTADNVVPPVYSELMVNAVNSNGGNASLALFEGVGHNSWVKAYEETELISWLTEQSLN